MSVIREADDKDIPKLVEIADICFPHSVHWSRKNPHAYRLWEFAISSKASEVWLYENTTGIQGLSLNILNEIDWKSARPQFYISNFKKFILFLRDPSAAYFFIRKSFAKQYRLSFSTATSCTAAPRLFVDFFAVTPNSRRKGVAAALLAKNSERANELGRNSVAYNVDKNNFGMLLLMRKHGYLALTENRKQITFTRKT